MENQVAESRIKKEVTKSPISFSRVYKSDYQKKGTLTVEIKQKVKTVSHYPKKSVSNSMSDSLFSDEEFNIETESYENIETRVAWVNAPEGSTEEEIKSRIAKFNESGATLYKVLSNKPILTQEQEYAINTGTTTIDIFANSQAVRYPEGVENAGQLATDPAGKVQYRAIFFSKSPKEDIDTRTEDPSDVYLSPELKSELNKNYSTVPGQGI